MGGRLIIVQRHPGFAQRPPRQSAKLRYVEIARLPIGRGRRKVLPFPLGGFLVILLRFENELLLPFAELAGELPIGGLAVHHFLLQPANFRRQGSQFFRCL